jgi:signal transduction histidine kinase
VIPHTFLDNAAKYSPKDGRVEVYVQDTDDGIDFAVSSYGPRILPREENLIFHPFYRGESAKRAEEEGAGYGLYLSQMIAQKHLGTTIKLNQKERKTGGMGHWTTFSIRVPLRAAIL